MTSFIDARRTTAEFAISTTSRSPVAGIEEPCARHAPSTRFTVRKLAQRLENTVGTEFQFERYY
jgi:hypothetical protein